MFSFTLSLLFMLFYLPPANAAKGAVIYVNPKQGNDAWKGVSSTKPKRSIAAAWQSIPASSELTKSVTIKLAPGVYKSSDAPNYWESRWGAPNARITLESQSGRASSVVLPSINMFDIRYLTIKNVRIESEFDPFHCEKCKGVEIRDSVITGIGDVSKYQGPQETIKVNQSQDISLIGNDISGATDNTIDFVAVQGGRIAKNRIHRSVDWCTYVKGGSASIVIEQNHVHDCGTGGITAGQGTGLEFMTAPWVRYEAYDISIRSNVLHDIDGAGLGVNGGYDILLANNSMQRVGARDHLLEVVFGERSCDGDASGCKKRIDAGGWGPSGPGGDPVYIGNREVRVANNLIVNTPPYKSKYTQFAIYSPRSFNAGNGPNPAVADKDLHITGNVISNGSDGMELGVGGDDSGCQDSNPTCNTAQIIRDNQINKGGFEVKDTFGALTLVSGIQSYTPPAIPALGWMDSSVPEGVIDDSVLFDFDGRKRSSITPIGAYTGVPKTQVVKAVVSGNGKVYLGTPGEKAKKVCQTKAKCGMEVLNGDWVVLKAVADSRNKFVGWKGLCAKTPTAVCVVKADKKSVGVSALFKRS